MVRNVGAGACIASVSSSTSAGSGGSAAALARWAPVRLQAPPAWRRCRPASSQPQAAGAGAGLGGGGGGAFATGGGSGALASGFGAGLVPSSSAMILRMEARISSIEGSCAFAACVIRRFPVRAPHRPAHAANQPGRRAICEDSREYCMGKVERKQSPVDRKRSTYNSLIGSSGRPACARRSTCCVPDDSARADRTGRSGASIAAARAGRPPKAA